MSESLTVKVPISPFRELSPNTGIHHMKRYRMKERAKQIARNETNRLHSGKHPLADTDTPITVAISIFWEKGRKRMDNDNALASTKSLIDGVAESLGVDDKRFVFPPIVQDRDRKGTGYTVFEITEGQP
jgi:crossover junction endodeoxyribonuclease RusA